MKSFLDQKESHSIDMPDGSVLNLYMGRKYNENNREANPTVCEVVDVGEGVDDISIGDSLVVHHNTLANEASQFYKKDGYTYLSIPNNSLIYGKVIESGEMIPIKGYIIAKRIPRQKLSHLDITEETSHNQFEVVTIPEGYDEVLPGQTIICYKFSDYEVFYHYKNIEHRVIRISTEDILAIKN